LKLGPLKVGRRPLAKRTKRPGEAPTFAVGHPIKLEALIALHEGPQSPGEIADRINADVSNVTNHLRHLYDAGCVEFAGREKEGERNLEKSIYRAVARPFIDDETYRSMSDEERYAATAVVLQWILAEMLSSFRNRKMDRDDDVVLISDNPKLDAVGRRELRELMTGTYEDEKPDARNALISIQEIESRAANRMAESGEKGTTMFFALMAFERGRTAADK
jgi:DNA-binding transcriptional ArsR family regulator